MGVLIVSDSQNSVTSPAPHNISKGCGIMERNQIRYLSHKFGGLFDAVSKDWSVLLSISLITSHKRNKDQAQ